MKPYIENAIQANPGDPEGKLLMAKYHIAVNDPQKAKLLLKDLKFAKSFLGKLSKNDFGLIFGVIVGIFAAGAIGIFIITSESSDDIDAVGFNNKNYNNTGFTKLNHATGIHKFSSSEDLKTFLKNLQTDFNPLFGEYYAVYSD